MRKARSQPLGATRFQAIQVLGDLKIYEDRIAVHRQESRLLEEEERARRRDAEEAARALEARKVAIADRVKRAVETMTDEQRAAWRWEERIADWLADEDGE